ncbi:MAG: response regulator transcription factor [Ignavibacteriaceae bacterium]|jgi:DNA-binding NarL/FixJ family response regulator|nr:response regulator transcription factor [Ignavibacteriaceae bacterium]
MEKIKIALVEDSKLLLARLAEGFSLYDSFKVVGKYSNGKSIINSLEKSNHENMPDIILMDIEMPKKNGIEATLEIKEKYPDIDIMMLTVFEDDVKIFASIQAGASGYMLKDEPFESILNAVHELYNGGAPISQSIARKVLSLIKSNLDEDKNNSSIHPELVLSERELELLNGLVNGGSYTTIANDLFLSPHTVKTHIKNIYKKLHVHTRAAAVRAWLGKL